MNFDLFSNQFRAEIDAYLIKHLPVATSPYCEILSEAMRYSVRAKGKRVRPLLCIASYALFEKNLYKISPYWAAIEWIHTYSLIHDDLPALDNDDYRRGELTNHKKFGDSTAILAGDTLNAFAFEHLCEELPLHFSPDKCLKAISLLAKACGLNGMGGGQFMDISAERNGTDADVLFIHSAKTGAILQSCVLGPAILTNCNDAVYKLLSNFGQSIGLLFQIVDDILDVTESSEILGKTANKDILQGKLTVVSVYGLDRARELAKNTYKNAQNDLSKIGNMGYDTEFLKTILDYFLERTY